MKLSNYVILYINSSSACVRLSHTTFCTGNLRGRFCNPSLCSFVRSSVRSSVCPFVCLDVFVSPSLKLTKMKKQKKKSLKVCLSVCASVCPDVFFSPFLKLRQTRHSSTGNLRGWFCNPSLCPFVRLSGRSACVCLTWHFAPVICEADFATPLCVRSFVRSSVCSPSICPSVRTYFSPRRACVRLSRY